MCSIIKILGNIINSEAWAQNHCVRKNFKKLKLYRTLDTVWTDTYITCDTNVYGIKLSYISKSLVKHRLRIKYMVNSDRDTNALEWTCLIGMSRGRITIHSILLMRTAENRLRATVKVSFYVFFKTFQFFWTMWRLN